ncbi:MAG: Ig-like domain-containing protein [Burkholderiaceae bacterium]
MAIAVKITSPQGTEEVIPLANSELSVDAVAGARYRLVDTESPDLSFEAIIRRLGDDLLIDVLGTDADVRLVDYFFVCELDYRGCSIELESMGGPLGELLTPDNESTTELSDGSVLLWASPPAGTAVASADQAQESAPLQRQSEAIELSEGSALPWAKIGLAGGGVLALAALAGGGGGGGGSDTAVGADRAGRGTLANRSISLARIESDAPAPVDDDGNSTTGAGIEISPGPIAAGGQTNDSTPTLSGSLDAELTAGQRVAVYRDGQEVGQAEVQGLQWRFTDSDVPAGERAYAARIADNDGNQSPLTDDFVLTIDGSAPDAPVVQAVTGDNVVSAEEAAAGVAVVGSAEAGSTVVAQWGQSSVSGQGDGSGQFVLQFTPENLPAAGVQSLSVTATDAFGNVSEAASSSVRLSADNGIAVTGVVDDVPENTGRFDSGATINDSTPTLVGVLDRTLQSGQSVQIIRNGVFVGNAEVEGLNWSFTDGRLANGSYRHTVRVINGDGSVAATTEESFVFDMDVSAPSRPSIQAVDTSNNRVTDASAADGVQVRGEAEAGTTVTVSWGNANQSSRVDADGDWQLTFETVPVGNGTSIIRAVSEDDAGNQSIQRAEFVRTNVDDDLRSDPDSDDDDDDDDADGNSLVISAADLLESSSAASLPGGNGDAGSADGDVQQAASPQIYAEDATLSASGSPVIADTFANRIESGF